MEVTTQQQGEFLVVALEGRLDAYWADHLSRSLDDSVSSGGHRIQVRMSGVSYMSSVGIRVLLRFYKQLESIGGSLRVVEPSEPVRSVLRMAGLETLLGSAATPPAQDPSQAGPQRIESHDTIYDVYDIAAAATLACQVVGTPHRLDGCGFGNSDCRTVAVHDSTFAVGLGAFGSGFEDCQGRFGEFLAAGGAAAYLPTDGTNAADYLLAAGAFMPEVSVLYALVCEGAFRSLLRFDTKPGAEPVALGSLAAQALELAGGDYAGIVMVAESAGLIGAALRRSPAAEATPGAPFTHPQVREWLSFTPEPAYLRHLALVVGVVARAPHPLLDPLVRALGDQQWPAGHFHAAVFPNRPLPKGRIELRRTVASLFETESLLGVLHLLCDDRQIQGAGASELVRGACWVGPIREVSR